MKCALTRNLSMTFDIDLWSSSLHQKLTQIWLSLPFPYWHYQIIDLLTWPLNPILVYFLLYFQNFSQHSMTRAPFSELAKWLNAPANHNHITALGWQNYYIGNDSSMHCQSNFTITFCKRKRFDLLWRVSSPSTAFHVRIAPSKFVRT